MESELGKGPVARRPGSKRESEELSELAQSVGARVSGPAGDDTSLSDLAAATGIRRNVVPTENPSSAQARRSSAPLDGWEQSANEYPVLIPGPDPNYKSRIRWPLVVLLLLALVATAGYFLGFQKWITTAKPQPPQAQSRQEETEAPAALSHPRLPTLRSSRETAASSTVRSFWTGCEAGHSLLKSTPSIDGAQPRYRFKRHRFPKKCRLRISPTNWCAPECPPTSCQSTYLVEENGSASV